MKILRVLALAAVIALAAQGCKKSNETVATQQEVQTVQPATSALDATGFYVSDGYAERDKGADWVSVIVTEADSNQLKIDVQSRTDIKKATCTFDGLAQKKDEANYVVTKDGKNILFTFGEKSMKISAEKAEDEDFLHFFCSGGATLAGEYSKTEQASAETK